MSRDRVIYAELRTDDLAQLEAFLRQNADKLESNQLSIRKSKGLFLAELFDAHEPSI